MYLLIANILLINLLIAVFNNIFNEVNSVSHQVSAIECLGVYNKYDFQTTLSKSILALSTYLVTESFKFTLRTMITLDNHFDEIQYQLYLNRGGSTSDMFAISLFFSIWKNF